MPVVTVSATATFAGLAPSQDHPVHDRCIPFAAFVATSRSRTGLELELETNLEYPHEPTVEQLATVAARWRAALAALAAEFGATLHWDGLRVRTRTVEVAGHPRPRGGR